MEKYKNQRIIFDLPESADAISVIDEILENNDLKEGVEEFFNKSIKGVSPRKITIRDATIDIFQKKTSEKKLVELLVKQLEISKQVAENIIKDINEKLIPYAKIIDLTKEADIESKQKEKTKTDYDKEKYRQDLLMKISPNSIPIKEIEEILPPKVKNPEVADVEKNAEKIQHTQKRGVDEKPAQEEKKKIDAYKETIE